MSRAALAPMGQDELAPAFSDDADDSGFQVYV
jgi:hypothetical protein